MRLPADYNPTLRIAPEPSDGPPLLDRGSPLASARQMVADRFTASTGQRLIHHVRGEWLKWTNATNTYGPVTADGIRSEVRLYLESARRLIPGSKASGEREREVPFDPRKRDVEEVIDALATLGYSADDLPTWIDADGTEPAADRLIVGRNGWIDPADIPLRMRAPDPRLLTTAALDFNIEPTAPRPRHWLGFLDSLDLHDDELLMLQQFMGYLLTGDTSHQKMLMLVGPRRSGKGTIGRIMSALVGNAGTCSPTLSSLGGPFGLAPLLNKRLALIADARLSGRSDQAIITERLLSVSGEDPQTIDRKHREALTVTLPTRFVILTNELPRLSDSSGALSGRLLILPLTRSFYGSEDRTLTRRLLDELPGILNWSLAGLRTLQQHDRFLQPVRGADMQAEMDDLASPVGAFVRDWCTVEPDATVECSDLFNAWKRWCGEQGRSSIQPANIFARDLRAVCPAITTQQPRSDWGGRVRMFVGIEIKPECRQ